MNNTVLQGFRKDLTKQKFNRLLVLEFAYMKNHNAYWKCRCDCGNITIVNGVDLRRGLRDKRKGTKSCGCLAAERTIETHTGNKYNIKEYKLASKNRVYGGYVETAKRRNIEFNLSFEDFISITSQECFYCGRPPSQSIRAGSYNGVYLYNGIDRVDNTIGYTLNNVVPCCKWCNAAKNTMTQNEFYSWIGKIYFRFLERYNASSS